MLISFRRSTLKCISSLLILILCGCSTTMVSHSSPAYQFVDTSHYYISITPIRSKNLFYAFRLIVKNKTFYPMEIDWNKTTYLSEDVAGGGFMFDGIEYKDRTATKPPEVILPNDIFIRTIWPNMLVERERDWFHQPIEDGIHGLEITLLSNRQIYKEKLLITIETVPEEND